MTSAAPPRPRPPAAAGRASRVRDLFTRRLGRRLHTAFVPVPGNALAAIDVGAAYYDRMAQAIDEAQRSCDAEMYLWDDDDAGRRFVDALARAARRGVRVRVLVDAYGAREIVHRLRDVTDAGGDVRVFNPFRLAWWKKVVHRTHRKLLLVDGAVAFTGGAGFSLHFSDVKRGEKTWHDRVFEISGPVVTQLEVAFESNFFRWPPVVERAPELDVTVPLLAPPRAAGPAMVRVLRGWPDARDFPTLALSAVRNAKERVWIGTPYFLPPRSMRHALYAAVRRGVDVRVVHPCLAHAHPVVYYAVRARYGRWISKGVKLLEFEPSFYHAKSFVVDRSLALVGSSNLDSWSWSRNAEIDLEITDPESVERVAALLAKDMERSRAVTREDARVRTFVASAMQTFASWIEHWL